MYGTRTGDKSYSVERNKHLQEIDALRIQVARTQTLEAENSQLSAELKEGVGFEEYNRVRENLLQLERAYGKLVWAREYLETKVRQQKDSLREWKEYRKIWILKHPDKQLSDLRPSSARAIPLPAAANRRSSSAPAPPAFPNGLTPSVSGVSRSPSPHYGAPASPQDIHSRLNQAPEHHSKDHGSPSYEAGVPEAGHNTAKASDSGDVTQATPESEGRAEPIEIKPDTGGSSPVVVLERTLKRRHSARAGAQTIHVHEDDQRRFGPAPGTLLTKNEQTSSPTLPPHLHLDASHDSLDLDDVGGHLDTPRKRQRMAQERLRSSIRAPLTATQDEEDILDNMTAEDLHAIWAKRDERTSLSPDNYKILPARTAEEEKKARRDKRMARQHAHNDQVYQRLEAAEKRNPISDHPRFLSPIANEPAQQRHTPDDPNEVGQQKPQLASPVVLQPRDVNASVPPRTSDHFANRKRSFPPSRRDRGAAYVHILAEDGEGLSSNGDALQPGKQCKDDQYKSYGTADKEAKAPPTHHRIGALLTKPSPEKPLLISEEPVDDVSSDQAWSKTPNPQSVVHHNPATPRSLPAKKSEPNHGPGNKSGLSGFEPVDAAIDRYSKSAQAVNKRTRNVPAFRKGPPSDNSETRPEHEPLRARPVHRLGLQDFKFNPAHSEYAYNETVRKHDEKKSLSGCTDRHCIRCKGLRKYIADSGYKTAQKPGESEDEADWRLMQEFLGDNHRQLRSMPKKERADLLVEAKVKEFANRYGCHRQAFSRPRDVPGYWEVDFPTTQEEAENRAAADVIEREKVQERYWEAMRPKGKWMFADE